MAQISGGRRDLSSDTGPRRSTVGGRRSAVGCGWRGTGRGGQGRTKVGSPLGFAGLTPRIRGGAQDMCRSAGSLTPEKLGGWPQYVPLACGQRSTQAPRRRARPGGATGSRERREDHPSDHTITPRSHPKAVTPAHPQRAPPATRTTAIAGLTRYRRMGASWPSASTNAEQSGRRTAWRSSGGCRPDRSRRRSRSRQPC
jgi:hypothetical protein